MSDSKLEILLVEDKLDDTRLVVETLNKTYPYLAIECVCDVPTALDFIFCTGKYASRNLNALLQLILLDLNLQGRGGFEVLCVAKAYIRTQTSPVVILTDTLNEQAKVKSTQLGASGYLVKPGLLRQFRQIVEMVCNY